MYARESFSTPFSPYVPWTHDVFEFPENWFWDKGRLTNDFDGEREFMYLHFLRMKSLWSKEDYYCQDLTKRIIINKLGFFEGV